MIFLSTEKVDCFHSCIPGVFLKRIIVFFLESMKAIAEDSLKKSEDPVVEDLTIIRPRVFTKDEYMTWKVKDLQLKLKELGLSPKGKKEELVNRIFEQQQ
jgi:ferredoxin-fold anticodon binding domain-containing protein